VRCIYLVECACDGNIDRSIIYQRRIDITEPELATFPYEKGKLYVFFLEGFKRERGNLTGWIGHCGPEPVEDDMGAGVPPEGGTPAP
jgi:hypothetical protein